MVRDFDIICFALKEEKADAEPDSGNIEQENGFALKHFYRKSRSARLFRAATTTDRGTQGAQDYLS
jgi:hypothetical protein